MKPMPMVTNHAVGVFFVKARPGETDALKPINRGFLVAGVLTMVALRLSVPRALKAYGATLHQLRWAIVTVMAVLALAFVMNLSGQTLMRRNAASKILAAASERGIALERLGVGRVDVFGAAGLTQPRVLGPDRGVVEPGAAQARVVWLEAERLHQVQRGAGVGAQPYDVARVGRDLW